MIDISEIILHVLEEASSETEDAGTSLVDFEEGYKLTKEGVIKNVHLVGLKSVHTFKGNKQPYTYSEDALKEAVATKVYEGADVFTGHIKDGEERNPKDKIALISNTSFKEGKGLFGDITFNTEHPYFPAMKWWVDNHPNKIAMSHDARVVFNAKENTVKRITKVKSVDIVNEGATTQGMFKEGVINDKRMADIESNKLNSIIDTAWNLLYNAKYPLGKSLTDQEKAAIMLPIAKDLVKELTAFSNTSTKESTMEWNDVTAETLAKNKPEVIRAIESAAEKRINEINTKLEEKIKDVPADKRSPVFVKQVRESLAANNEALADELVNDRKALVSKQAVESHGRQLEKTETEIVKEGANKKAIDLTDEAILAAFNNV